MGADGEDVFVSGGSEPQQAPAHPDAGGVFHPDAGRDDEPVELEPRAQKPLAVQASRYVEVGRVSVVEAPDGGVQIAGEPRDPAPGLTYENLVCTEDPATGRQKCQHYVAILTDAEGITKGFGDRPRQIRRYCTKLATATELMELGDAAVYACEARSPQDLVSIRRIRDFENEQRRRANEAARESGEIDL